jgi:hypothetical protein
MLTGIGAYVLPWQKSHLLSLGESSPHSLQLHGRPQSQFGILKSLDALFYMHVNSERDIHTVPEESDDCVDVQG